jgi:ATP-dependent DNA helicase RecQ
VPALLGDGLTLVVSPLISLMQDQVRALVRRGVPAAYLNSTLTREDRATVLESVRRGVVRLLYGAPERLPALARWLARAEVRVGLLAVDEAHCITEWGHAFRPVYRRLGEIRYRLGDPVTVALTGSATPAARREILAVLRLPRAIEVVASFDRPNLRFEVVRVADDRGRFDRLRRVVRDHPGSAIVYAPTRRLVELLTRALLRLGTRAVPYHAGLPLDLRRRVLLRFLRDGERVIVATTAFGMGIDKAKARVTLCGLTTGELMCSLVCRYRPRSNGSRCTALDCAVPVLVAVSSRVRCGTRLLKQGPFDADRGCGVHPHSPASVLGLW